jgi:hypothetical protein
MVGKDALYGFRLDVVQNKFENEELYQGLADALAGEGRAFTDHQFIAIIHFQTPSPFKQHENLVRGDPGVLRPSAAAK